MLVKTEKFGIQVKNNNDVIAKDFTTKLKAQITESKKHSILGLIILFAADTTETAIESKIRIMQSDLSQIKERYTKAVPPEKIITMIKEIG